jgi:hypothetical protein
VNRTSKTTCRACPGLRLCNKWCAPSVGAFGEALRTRRLCRAPVKAVGGGSGLTAALSRSIDPSDCSCAGTTRRTATSLKISPIKQPHFTGRWQSGWSRRSRQQVSPA